METAENAVFIFCAKLTNTVKSGKIGWYGGKMLEEFYNTIFNLIYPARCGFCNEITGTNSFICDNCKYRLKQEYANRCMYCGKVTLLRDICSECKDKKIYYDKLVFFNEYTKEFREKIHSYKFRDKKFYYNFFEELIYDKLCDTEADIIIPVPVSSQRLKDRGYNQSALIGEKLAKDMKIEYSGEILTKVRNSEKQSMQNFHERQESVKNIFQIADILGIRGKRVILIDDVFATGATANECSKELTKAGAKSVVVAVISISHTLK